MSHASPRPEAISLDNWLDPPHNRWSYRNVEQILPTALVRRGGRRPSVLPHAGEDLDNISFKLPGGEVATVGETLARSHTDAFLVLHHGAVVTEKYWSGMTASSLHLSQSVSKSVVAMLAGALWGRGLLDLQAPLGQLIPELADSGYGDATLDQVLDMASGIEFNEDYEDPNADVFTFEAAAGWRTMPDGSPCPPGVRHVIPCLLKARPHGISFQYRSVETAVLCWALERCGGARLAELLSREIWSKLGCESNAAFTVDGEGVAIADGGFLATLRDYGRFGLMVLDRGKAGKEQVVPADWIAETRRGDPQRYGGNYSSILPHGAYRRHWWIADHRTGDLMARGVAGQLLYVNFASGLVIVKLSSWPRYVEPELAASTFGAIDAIVREFGG